MRFFEQDLLRQPSYQMCIRDRFKARAKLVSEGFSDIRLCIETMGKINQLGNLEEVLELVKLDDSFLQMCIRDSLTP